MNTSKTTSLPSDPTARKAAPIAEGVLFYFPNALAEVAKVSKAGNDQHNPGKPLHWSRGKSTDHADCIVRHLIDAGTIDSDGMRHSAKIAWRALAMLQEELEREEGYPLPRNARFDKEKEIDKPAPEYVRTATVPIPTGDPLVNGRVPDVQADVQPTTQHDHGFPYFDDDRGMAGHRKPRC